MQKKILQLLFTLSFLLGLGINEIQSAPISKANIDDTFNVFEVFCLGENCSSDESSDRQDRFIVGIKQEAEEKDISYAAAIILKIINILSLLVGTFSMIVIIYAGVTFVISAGNESQIDQAKATFSSALIGLVLAFGAYFIVTFVNSFFY